MEDEKKRTNTPEYNHAYYEQHKDKFLNKSHCEVCNKQICNASMKKHKQSIKHLMKTGELTTKNNLSNNELQMIVNEVMKRMKND